MPLNYNSYDEILRGFLTRLSENTNITQLSPGAKARAILEAIANETSVLAQDFDLELAEAFVRTSSGINLDMIGELVNVTRLEAQKSIVDVAHQNIKFNVISGTFGDINNSNDILVTSGTSITARSGFGGVSQTIDFVTSEDVLLAAAATEGYVSAISLGVGGKYVLGPSSINTHNFTNYLGYEDDSLKVINLEPILGGADRESDENYRYRISKAITASEAANETAIRLAALSVSGVSDVVTEPYTNGTGTFTVYVKSIYPIVSTSLIDQVHQSVKKTQAYGNKGTVRSPKNVGIELVASISYRKVLTSDELATIEGQIEDAIIDYINNLDIGEDLIIDEIIQRVLDVDENIKQVGTVEKKFDSINFYRDSRLQDNRLRQTLLGNYNAYPDERVVVEYTIASPIIIRSV